jgi:molecular chaperone DnaK (HSP70)
MKLGIDFGTTRIVVAAVDRGNYPVAAFEGPDLVAAEWFPPLVAARGSERLYGWQAWAAQGEPGWTFLRSLKRALEGAGPETKVQIGDQSVAMLELLREMALALKATLYESSSLSIAADEPLEAVVGVPANAGSNQRYLTAEAFQQAGFRVLGLLNEPSAASIEFGHRQRSVRQKKEPARILVYDLGGGTFDASLVEVNGNEHSVIASEGIATLGGDDFDELLAELALERIGADEGALDALSQGEIFRLHEECQEKKESLHSNTRRLEVDLGCARGEWGPVTVAVADFYDRCRPMIEETLNATEGLLAEHGSASAGADVLYVTGGGSELPLVARMLRERFGGRVRRSAYTRSATAIGLAIRADDKIDYRVRERFTRHFGVWRETDNGHAACFDPLFEKGTPLPGPDAPPIESFRRYVPVHNVGHFRFLECSRLGEDGSPAGDVTVWEDIRFPFDPSLRSRKDLNEVPVERVNPAILAQAEEGYRCDARGILEVTITTPQDAYSRLYRLGSRAPAVGAASSPRKRKRSSRK